MKWFLLFICLFPSFAFSQVKGMWHGYITSINKELNSKYILNIKEESEGVVKGYSYIYRENYSALFAKLKFTGTIKDNNIQITETDLLVGFTPVSKEDFCFKSSDLNLTIQDTSSYLTGAWSGILANKDRCVPGEVYLKRTNPSDKLLIPDEIIEEIDKEGLELDSFLNRGVSFPKVISVKSKTITVFVRDYEKIDNDIISVYFNGKKIIDESRLRKKALYQTIKLDTYTTLNELVIYAHNLGEIPPNTCMLIVDDGINKQTVFIESSFENSASVLLRYDAANKD